MRKKTTCVRSCSHNSLGEIDNRIASMCVCVREIFYFQDSEAVRASNNITYDNMYANTRNEPASVQLHIGSALVCSALGNPISCYN